MGRPQFFPDRYLEDGSETWVWWAHAGIGIGVSGASDIAATNFRRMEKAMSEIA